MRRAAVGLLGAAVLLLGAGRASALDEGPFLFRFDPRLWGADAALGYRGWRLFPRVDTVFWVSAGGGVQSLNFFPGDQDSPPLSDAGYASLNLDWRLGVSQGILYNPAQERNLLEWVLLYRGKLMHYLEATPIPADYPDRDGLWQNSLLTGLVYDTVYRDSRTLTRRGFYAAATGEVVPRWLLNDLRGDSNYARLSLVLSGYLPLLSRREISIYAADRLLLDALLGEPAAIPVSATTSFGALSEVPIGTNPLHGLGGAVRGIANERFDGLLKAANGVDLRLHFPALTLFGLVTPGIVAYFDAGVSDRMSGRLSFDPVYLATGAGVQLYALGYDVVLYGNYFVNERDFSISIALGAHF